MAETLAPGQARRLLAVADGERLRALFENALDAVVGMDMQGRVTDWNGHAEILFGWTRKEAIGRRMSETLIPERYRDAHEKGLRHFLATGEGPILNRRIEIMALHRNGTEFPVELSVTPIQMDSAWSFYSFLRDITERKRAENALQEKNAILNGIIEGTSDAVFVKDRIGRYLLINTAGANHIGRKPQEVLGKTDADLFPPEMARKIMADDAEVVRTQRENRYEEEVVTDGGRVKTFFSNKSPFLDEKGNVVGMIGIARDITESKRAENRLRISEMRFRSLFHEAPLGIQIGSTDGRILEVNDSWKELWQVSQEEVERQFFRDYSFLKDPQLKAKGVLPYLTRAAQGTTVRIPAVFYDPAEIGKPGRSRWLETMVYFIPSTQEVEGELVFIHRDISDKMRAERVLKMLAAAGKLIETELDQRAALQRTAKLAIETFPGWCLVHLRGENGSLNLAAVEHERPEMAEQLRTLCIQFPLPDEAPSGPSWVARTGAPELVTKIEGAHLSQFQRLKPRSSITVPLRARRKILGTMTLLSSDRRLYREDLDLAQELAGRAAMAIQNAALYDEAQRAILVRDEFLLIASHELKTPLTPLSVQLQTIKRLAERGQLSQLPAEQIKSMVFPAIKQLGSLERLIEDLLDVSRISAGKFQLKKETTDLSSLVSEAAERLASQLTEAGCALELRVRERVVGNWDPLRIDEVVVNLLSNAVKYGAGKPIEVEVAKLPGWGVFSVRDHGIGIAKENQDKIFDRFARAVSPYKYGGLGLGLYIASEIVRAHGGVFRLESQPGLGSKFTVELPLESQAIG